MGVMQEKSHSSSVEKNNDSIPLTRTIMKQFTYSVIKRRVIGLKSSKMTDESWGFFSTSFFDAIFKYVNYNS